MSRCGDCSLCCTILAVPELDKPANVPCVHLTKRGCGIYEDRPQACRDYECIFLKVGLQSSFRPSRMRFLVDLHMSGEVGQIKTDPNFPDAAKTAVARKFLRRFRKVPMLEMHPDGGRSRAANKLGREYVLAKGGDPENVPIITTVEAPDVPDS